MSFVDAGKGLLQLFEVLDHTFLLNDQSCELALGYVLLCRKL